MGVVDSHFPLTGPSGLGVGGLRTAGTSARPAWTPATSLVGEQTQLVRTMTALGVNAGVVVALSIALVLVRRFASLDRPGFRRWV